MPGVRVPADSGTGATAGKVAGMTCCRFYFNKTRVGKSSHACAQFITRSEGYRVCQVAFELYRISICIHFPMHSFFYKHLCIPKCFR